MVDIEQKDQEMLYDYSQRLKEEYKLVLNDLGEKYHISLDDYKGELDSLKTQLSIDEFIDIAKKKAENLWFGKEEYAEFNVELIERFEAIQTLIHDMAPELEKIRKELLEDPSTRSTATKKYIVQQGRVTSSQKIQKILLNMEKGLATILKPLGKFGDRLLHIFQSLLKNAGITL